MNAPASSVEWECAHCSEPSALEFAVQWECDLCATDVHMPFGDPAPECPGNCGTTMVDPHIVIVDY